MTNTKEVLGTHEPPQAVSSAVSPKEQPHGGSYLLSSPQCPTSNEQPPSTGLAGLRGWAPQTRQNSALAKVLLCALWRHSLRAPQTRILGKPGQTPSQANGEFSPDSSKIQCLCESTKGNILKVSLLGQNSKGDSVQVNQNIECSFQSMGLKNEGKHQLFLLPPPPQHEDQSCGGQGSVALACG